MSFALKIPLHDGLSYLRTSPFALALYYGAPDRAVNALVEIISDTLKKSDSLTLPGFGTFEVCSRAARTGRNPKTGEELEIAASRIAAFKPGAALKAAVNGAGK